MTSTLQTLCPNLRRFSASHCAARSGTIFSTDWVRANNLAHAPRWLSRIG